MSADLSPTAVITRVTELMNQRDLRSFVACFDPDYESEQPAHPDRHFRGRAQVERNWSMMFRSLPDFHAEILSLTSEGKMAWVEWHWTGTRPDKSLLNARGVCLFEIANGLLKRGRLYMEDVSRGEGITAAVESLARRNP